MDNWFNVVIQAIASSIVSGIVVAWVKVSMDRRAREREDALTTQRKNDQERYNSFEDNFKVIEDEQKRQGARLSAMKIKIAVIEEQQKNLSLNLNSRFNEVKELIRAAEKNFGQVIRRP